ncbi:Uncharacterized protein TCAP_07169, partial [Tolypocladium capitatum]
SPAAVLVVAVAAPILARAPGPRSKAVRWARAQALLADLYSIVASVCAERAIPSHLGGDEPGTVDARVVLVDRDARAGVSLSHPGEANCTPVLGLAAFAATVHPWRTVFHASGEPGYELLAAFLALAEGRQKLLQSQIVVVEGGLSLSNPAPALDASQARGRRGAETGGRDEAVEGYGTVCLGGTFDHLHPGHKLLLHAAVLLLRVPDADALESGGEPCVLIVGISGDELLVKKRYAEELQPWDARARSVVAFLATALNSPTTAVPVITSASNDAAAGASSNATELHAAFCNGAVLVRCVDIRDAFGPTTAEQSIDAIVVSGETRAGGRAINERREARGWRALAIYEIDVLDANGGDDSDDDAADGEATEGATAAVAAAAAAAAADRFAAKISSTEIRRQKAEARSRRR